MVRSLNLELDWLVDRPALNAEPCGRLIAEQPLALFAADDEVAAGSDPALQGLLIRCGERLGSEPSEIDGRVFAQILDAKRRIELAGVMRSQIPAAAPGDLVVERQPLVAGEPSAQRLGLVCAG